MGVNVLKDETYRDYIHFLLKKYTRILAQIPSKTHPEFSTVIKYLEKEEEKFMGLSDPVNLFFIVWIVFNVI